MGTFSLAVLPGDGVGPEVINEAVRVLEVIGQRFGHEFQFRPALVGGAAIATEGAAISDKTMALCQQSDAILFGAVGGGARYDRPDAKAQPEQALFRLRKELELYANLRPVRALEPLLDASTLKPDILRGTDFIVIRELTGGLYYGKPSEIRETSHGLEAVDTLLYTEGEIERILHTAFQLARRRRRRLTSVDKANVLSSSRLWRRVANRVAETYPDVTLTHLLIDSCAMQLVRQPTAFDVIVTENMFGDILTDEVAVLAGSMGMLPSASLGLRRTAHGIFGLYEPVHGTAPDIAGQGRANPLAAILSAALLLRHSCGLEREATAVESAVGAVLAAGHRTEDLAPADQPALSTRKMGDHVVKAIYKL
jgi:3-isopropylmalate dehydrogenase